MNKPRKLQDYAEDINPSQSDDMEEQPQGDSSSDELAKAVKQIAAAAAAISRNSETIGLVANGFGRYLLNEDGTVRDFTNVKLMEETAKNVNEGVLMMNKNAAAINEKMDKMPTTITAELSGDACARLSALNKHLRWAIIVFISYVVVMVAGVGYASFRASKINDRAEQLSRWYEEKRDDILFGRYLRWHNNGLWKKMREEWSGDPGMKDDMFDYFEIEDRRGGKVKK